LNSKTIQLGQLTHFPDLLRFPVRVKNAELRNRILLESDRRGLGIMFTYPNSIDGIEELKGVFQGVDFPAAKKTAQNLITLPIHAFVSQKDKKSITALIAQTKY
jgi:dTDP-4-amino-4,6-dideoxygalactose transaminase